MLPDVIHRIQSFFLDGVINEVNWGEILLTHIATNHFPIIIITQRFMTSITKQLKFFFNEAVRTYFMESEFSIHNRIGSVCTHDFCELRILEKVIGDQIIIINFNRSSSDDIFSVKMNVVIM